jgi:peptidoglycan L-alanyl-D-glutamate endopeptidase CwlK
MALLLHENLLRGVHPALVMLCHTWQAQLKFDVKVLSGVRTDAEQGRLYAQGRTAPGPQVTNAQDATTSPHGIRWWGDRVFGCAADVCPVDDNGNRWDNPDAYEEMATWAYRRTDIDWGGRWKTLVDKAHWEMAGWRECPAASSSLNPDFTGVRGGVS